MKKTIILLIIIFSCALSAQNQPYVLLVSFDGFRWDYLNRGLTPNLNLMRKEGASASSLRPTYPSKTFPNHLAIITGMYNDHHGIIMNHFENPYTREVYRLGDTVSVRDSKWYRGEFFWETAERQGIRTASFFWPGSELADKNRRPDIFKKFNQKEPYRNRVDTVASWFGLPQSVRPHFVTLYFSETDTYGHKYGPNSAEVNEAIKDLDNIVGYLREKLTETGMLDSVNIIFVSDHGMTEISPDREINIGKKIADYKVKIEGGGPLMTIKPEKNDIDAVVGLLKKSAEHFQVYKKENLPDYYHFKDNAFIYPVILTADLGWTLTKRNSKKIPPEKRSKGNHGYNNNEIDMHGIFVARGPAVKKGFRTGTLWNIDIYPLLCEIFNIQPNFAIDGRKERIDFILK